jgi:hypothetical protein
LLSGPTTALINALRGYLAEIGFMASIAPLAKIEAYRKTHRLDTPMGNVGGHRF